MKDRDGYTGQYASSLTEAAAAFRAGKGHTVEKQETRVELPQEIVDQIEDLNNRTLGLVQLAEAQQNQISAQQNQIKELTSAILGAAQDTIKKVHNG